MYCFYLAVALAFVSLVLLRVFIPTRHMSLLFITIAVIIKYAVPVIYFSFIYQTGAFHINDDLTYIIKGTSFLHNYNNIIMAFIAHLGSVHNWFYGWWNGLLQYFFGVQYFVPVLFNVLITCVAAIALFHLVKAAFNRSNQYCAWVSGFFLLHWSVISWSSFLNIKDSIILMFTIFAFLYFDGIFPSFVLILSVVYN